MDIHLTQSASFLPADTETPISLFLKRASHGILLESAEVDGRWGRYSVLVFDTALAITCLAGKLALRYSDPCFADLAALEGQDFVPGLRALLAAIRIDPPQGMEDLPAITRALYGYFGFGMVRLFSERLAKTIPADEAECSLILPATVLVFDHLYNRLCHIELAVSACEERCTKEHETRQDTQGVATEITISAEPDAKGYMATVAAIKEELTQGEAIQVVPSVRFHTPFRGDTFTLYRRMRRFNASPYMFYMQFPHITLLGSSPEVMVRCTGNTLTLSPIAGTRKRGKDAREDAFFASELLRDPKECAEHVMLVDLGRNDLGRIARPGSVKVDRLMQIERFSHVMHITSTVTAILKDGLDALDVLAATFPAGTVSGAPKIRAIELIRKHEGRERGPYAGCIGWIGLDHGRVDLDMGITIRSMWHDGKNLFWQAGGGIVHDSDPELEWNEVYNKSAIMRHVLQAKDEAYVSAHR